MSILGSASAAFAAQLLLWALLLSLSVGSGAGRFKQSITPVSGALTWATTSMCLQISDALRGQLTSSFIRLQNCSCDWRMHDERQTTYTHAADITGSSLFNKGLVPSEEVPVGSHANATVPHRRRLQDDARISDRVWCVCSRALVFILPVTRKCTFATTLC
jgi:hypothetical protein